MASVNLNEDDWFQQPDYWHQDRNQGGDGNRGSGQPTSTNPGGPVTNDPTNNTMPGQGGNTTPYQPPSGVPAAWAEDFLRRNPGDYHRVAEAYSGETSHRPYDSQSLNQYQQQQNALADSQRGTIGGAGRTSFNYAAPPFQFDDPYTKRLEDLVNQHLKALEQPQSNPALDGLLAFLNKRFGELSTAPGYSPEELALVRTQMLEPIEQDRAAGTQRVIERTAARGFAPSSGLHELDLREVDKGTEERRIRAQRDLAVDAIDRRDKDLTSAATIGQLAGVTIPGMQRSEDQQRRTEALQLATLLYELPGRALQENLSVLQGTPGPESLFNQAIQLQNSRAQQSALNMQKWANIGAILAGMNF